MKLADLRKVAKYAGLDSHYLFVPIAFENLAVLGNLACKLLANLGAKLAKNCG